MERLPEAGFQLAEHDTVGVFEIFIKTTPERLWEAITDPKQRAKYSFGVETHSDWTPGSEYTAGVPGAVDIAAGENLEVDSPRRLVQASPRSGATRSRPTGPRGSPGRSSRSRTPAGWTVVHDQLRPGANAELYGGWPMILSGLKTLLGTGEILTTPGSLRYAQAQPAA